jgi:hypothetical protein
MRIAGRSIEELTLVPPFSARRRENLYIDLERAEGAV